MDLALVELDLGGRAALTIARLPVMFLHRTGNQAQFSTQLTAQYADHRPRCGLLTSTGVLAIMNDGWILAIDADASVPVRSGAEVPA